MKLTRFIPLILFVVVLSAYWLTANPLPSGYADSDELALAGHLFSVAHPPGYGLNVVLVGLFQRLLFFLPAATSANLLAGIFHSLTLVFLYLGVTKITQTNRWLIAAGTLITGLSGLFWLYGSVIEIMSLGNLFAALVIYLSLSYTQIPHRLDKYLPLISLIWGLGIGHLQTLVLLGPGLAYLLIAYLPRKNFSTIAAKLGLAIGLTVLGFLLSSAIILPLNARHQSYSWNFPQTLPGWWHMITRQDYKGVFLDKDVVVEDPYFQGISLDIFNRIPTYLITTWNQYAGLPVLVTIAGLIFLWQLPDKRRLIGLSIYYLFAGLLFGSYVTLTDYNPEYLQFRLLAGTAHRQYLLGYTILGLFSGLGFIQLAKFVKKSLVYITVAVTLISLFIANYPFANQRQNRLLYDYADLILTNAKPDSFIVCASDFACFSLLYQSVVDQKRPDVAVATIIPRGRKNFLQAHPEYADFLYPENPSFVAHLIAFNTARRPTYFTSVEQFYIDYLGLNGNPFFATTKDYLIEISPRLPAEKQPDQTDAYLRQLAAYSIDNRDLHLLGFKDYLASYYQIEALYQTKYGNSHTAAAALDKALYLNQNDPRVVDWRFKLDTFTNLLRFDTSIATGSAEYLDLAQTYVEQNQLKQAEEAARKAYYLNPTDPAALLLLNSLYRDHNYPLFADWTQSHLDYLKTQL